MALDSVWEALKDGRWESKTELGAASGVDEDALTRIINFLHSWNLVDVQGTREVLVRRKLNAISPIVTFQFLRSIEERTDQRVRLIAERVAYRSCGARQLTLIGQNEVECCACGEKQWKAMALPESLFSPRRKLQLKS